jgi:hypothetical protein
VGVTLVGKVGLLARVSGSAQAMRRASLDSHPRCCACCACCGRTEEVGRGSLLGVPRGEPGWAEGAAGRCCSRGASLATLASEASGITPRPLRTLCMLCTLCMLRVAPLSSLPRNLEEDPAALLNLCPRLPVPPVLPVLPPVPMVLAVLLMPLALRLLPRLYCRPYFSLRLPLTATASAVLSPLGVRLGAPAPSEKLGRRSVSGNGGGRSVVGYSPNLHIA